MPKRWKDPALYKKLYKHDLPWSRALWITCPGDYLRINNVLNIVRYVELLPIAGAVPSINVEEIEDGDDNTPLG